MTQRPGAAWPDGWLDLQGYAEAWAAHGDGDPYFRPEFMAASALLEQRAAPAAYAEHGLLYPFLERSLPDGLCDLTSAYGFGGPAAAAPGWRERFRRAAEQRGAVSEFIRFHPLRRNHELAGDGVEVAHVQDMVVVDVRAGDDALRAQMGSQGRRNLRRAEREGVTARLVDDMPAFHLRYIDAMRRLDAAPFYHFPAAYFEALRSLGDGLLIIDTGQSSALYLLGGGAMHYHLGETSDEGRRSGAATMMHFEAMRHARERGLKQLHLGGGLRAGDALARFKASLGSGRAPYHVGRAVLDRSRYDQLCAAAGVAPDAERFPAYRASEG